MKNVLEKIYESECNDNNKEKLKNAISIIEKKYGLKKIETIEELFID